MALKYSIFRYYLLQIEAAPDKSPVVSFNLKLLTTFSKKSAVTEIQHHWNMGAKIANSHWRIAALSRKNKFANYKIQSTQSHLCHYRAAQSFNTFRNHVNKPNMSGAQGIKIPPGLMLVQIVSVNNRPLCNNNIPIKSHN